MMEITVPNNEFVALATSPLDDLRAAKRELSARFLVLRPGDSFSAFSATSPAPADNVVGVGVGEKHSAGQPTGVMAIKLLVQRKYPAGQLGANEALPQTIDGLPTDVEEVGTVRRFQLAAAPVAAPPLPDPRTRMRPAHPGSSIGFLSPDFRMAGTFGALVTAGGQRYILSNNHVIADEDQLAAGAPIVQPGALDGGDPATDVVAHFSRAVPLQSGTANEVDAALAELVQPDIASPDVLFIGPPAGVGTAFIDMAVHKFGRTTSYTAGRVTSVDTDVVVKYEKGNLLFQEQIIIVGATGGSFSAPGDSGSLILERGSNRAVGLLFAGSSSHTIANHLQKVLDALTVTLA
jgi:hypothetical protein